MPRTLRASLVALAAALGLMLVGCGSDEPSAADKPTAPPAQKATQKPSQQPSEKPTQEPTQEPTQKPAGTTIDITFKGDQVDPAGVEKRVQAGEPITLHIVADAPGELHVHTSPEQEIAYPVGTTDKTLTIDRPGVVEVESHNLDRLVVQLEVR